MMRSFSICLLAATFLLAFTETALAKKNFFFTNTSNSLQPPSERPLIVWLHGCTQTSQEFIEQTQLMSKLAQAKLDALVYAPQQSRSNNPLACWNWFLKKNQKRDSGILQEITQEVQKLIAQKQVSPEKIYIGGFSAGAVLAAHFAFCYPDIFRGALIHSGSAYKVLARKMHPMDSLGLKAIECSEKVDNRRLQDILIIHGTEDKITSLKNAQKVYEQSHMFFDFQDDFRFNQSLRQTFTSAHLNIWESSSREQITYYTIHGMGHAWSGGDKNYRFSSPNTLSATDLFIRMILK